MSLSFDLFWSFRSPYSFLATPRLRALERDYDLEIQVRVVLPIAVRLPGFFDKVNPLWPPYLIRDTLRIAQKEGLTYSWPNPDPIVQDPATRKVAEEQPYIWRLSRLGLAATERGRGVAYLESVSSLIFGGQANWHEGDHLARAAERAGLDGAELEAAALRDADRYDAVLAQNGKDLEAAGHWGVPTMVFEGEPFFGQDRIDLLVWRLEQKGLARRSG